MRRNATDAPPRAGSLQSGEGEWAGGIVGLERNYEVVEELTAECEYLMEVLKSMEARCSLRAHVSEFVRAGRVRVLSVAVPLVHSGCHTWLWHVAGRGDVCANTSVVISCVCHMRISISHTYITCVHQYHIRTSHAYINITYVYHMRTSQAYITCVYHMRMSLGGVPRADARGPMHSAYKDAAMAKTEHKLSVLKSGKSEAEMKDAIGFGARPCCCHSASAPARLTYPAPPRDRFFFTTAQPFPGRACAQRRCACVLVPVY